MFFLWWCDDDSTRSMQNQKQSITSVNFYITRAYLPRKKGHGLISFDLIHHDHLTLASTSARKLNKLATKKEAKYV